MIKGFENIVLVWHHTLLLCIYNQGELGSDALFRVKESVDHLVCFESILQPGLFLLPPLHNTATTPSPQFIIEIVPWVDSFIFCNYNIIMYT